MMTCSEHYMTDGMIRLRAPEPEDVEHMYRWENDSSLWHTGNARAPYSRAQLLDYIITYNADIYATGQMRMVIEKCMDGEPVGTVDLYDFDPVHRRCGVGILVDEAHRGCGIGGHALKLICRWLFGRLGLHQVWCVAAAGNEVSQRVFASAGFRVTGCLKQWLRQPDGEYGDAVIMQRLDAE